MSCSKNAIHYSTTEGRHHTKADEDNGGHQHLPLILYQMSTNDSQKGPEAENDSWIVATDSDVLCPGSSGQTKDQDEYGDN